MMKVLANMPEFQSIVSMQDLDVAEVEQLISRAEDFKAGAQLKLTEPVYVSNLFFENSTRTHTSFEMAERKLGLTVINFDPQASSMSKGETLHDTALSLDAVGVNLLVVRHPQNDYYNELLGHADLSLGLINAGDGSGEHPSQSLLDMMTIAEQFGDFTGLRVAIIGDLTHSRVARSNMEILQRLGAELFFSGPKAWYSQEFAQYGTYLPIDDLVEKTDVMMLLRVQHERHPGEQAFDTQSYFERYGLTKERASRLPEQAIIMHPGPVNRNVELASDLVEGKQSRFVTQMQNGVYMRMAMLESVLRGNHLGGLV
ncbi:aspartate carbamoyltransferase catalytic subunit [Loigolactobacillus iwatensis]|uniref:aspartate carbamoyltransferase catalytic subunit n=1 Tax=Loigolactobacillus iwatensis TaxID=1267156 RepID=UPI000F7D7D41|nr:aspartate carbamoyltransferase catalytic subunit [Loigolactobacillus iwatensis]